MSNPIPSFIRCSFCGGEVKALQHCSCRALPSSSKPEFQEPPSIYGRPIQEHGGGKYLRKIYPADGKGEPIMVDIYCVIEAFRGQNPVLNMGPAQHALKKLLCTGVRGKGDVLDDVHGIFDALWRLRELLMQQEKENV